MIVFGSRHDRITLFSKRQGPNTFDPVVNELEMGQEVAPNQSYVSKLRHLATNDEVERNYRNGRPRECYVACVHGLLDGSPWRSYRGEPSRVQP